MQIQIHIVLVWSLPHVPHVPHVLTTRHSTHETRTHRLELELHIYITTTSNNFVFVSSPVPQRSEGREGKGRPRHESKLEPDRPTADVVLAHSVTAYLHPVPCVHPPQHALLCCTCFTIPRHNHRHRHRHASISTHPSIHPSITRASATLASSSPTSVLQFLSQPPT
jgi:hypothetical protein